MSKKESNRLSVLEDNYTVNSTRITCRSWFSLGLVIAINAMVLVFGIIIYFSFRPWCLHFRFFFLSFQQIHGECFGFDFNQVQSCCNDTEP